MEVTAIITSYSPTDPALSRFYSWRKCIDYENQSITWTNASLIGIWERESSVGGCIASRLIDPGE